MSTIDRFDLLAVAGAFSLFVGLGLIHVGLLLAATGLALLFASQEAS